MDRAGASADASAVPYNLSTDVLLPHRSCADSVSYSVIELGSSYARVSPAPEPCCLHFKDWLLLINQQGTPSSVENVGRWEAVQVEHVAGDRIGFRYPKTLRYGSGADDDDNIGINPGQQRVALYRMPYYNGLSVSDGAILTADAWDGLKGGVMALRGGYLNINGAVTMSGKGFAGGAPACGASGAARAQPGESIAGPGLLAQEDSELWPIAAAANVMGGGGGCFESSGATIGGAGGVNGTAGESLSCASSCSEACQPPAAGGISYGNQDLRERIYLGSGGGGGGSTDPCDASAGGAGGGVIIHLGFGGFTVTGSFRADGASASAGHQPGGAGAGGAIYTETSGDYTIGDGRVSARGGEAATDGAAGGAGRIMLSPLGGTGVSGTTDPEAYVD